MTKTDLTDKSIYLWPVNIPSIYVYHYLKRKGIKTIAFIDNDITKHSICYDGTKIIHPSCALPDAIFVLCELLYEIDILRQLNSLGFNNYIRCDEIIDNEYSFDALKDVNHNDLSQMPLLAPKLYAGADELIRAVIVPKEHRHADALILPTLNITVTSRCTLNCRDCSNLIQYYKNPCDTQLDRILKSIDLLMANIDYIPRIIILGGEPLLYNRLGSVIIHLNKFINKIGLIAVTTNGTLLPSDEMLEAMKSSKIACCMFISNYGELSSRKEDVTALLQETGIDYHLLEAPKWHDCCKIIDGKDRTEDEIQNMYTRCTICACMLYENKLYFCNFLAHGTVLGAIPMDTSNYIDLDAPDLSKSQIRDYLERPTAFPGCRNCNGFCSYDVDKIPVAIQAKGKLPYTIVSV